MSQSLANPGAWYEDLLAVPHVHGGEDPATGLDCLGLMKEIYRRLGIVLDMPEFPFGENWEERVAPFVTVVTANRWTQLDRPSEVGDVILMRGPGGPLHVAVLITPTMAIHTNEVQGVCVQRVSRPGFAPLIEGVYRHAPS